IAAAACLAATAQADTVEPSLIGDWSCSAAPSDANYSSQVAFTATYGENGTYTAKSDATIRTPSVGRYRVISTDTGTYTLVDGLLVTTATDVTAETTALAGRVAEEAGMLPRITDSVDRSAKAGIGKPKTRRINWTDENNITLQDNAEGTGTTYECGRGEATD
ncbi:MAG: hypothetical protein RIF42_17195, partial [Parvibaculaceae bacterium]